MAFAVLNGVPISRTSDENSSAADQSAQVALDLAVAASSLASAINRFAV